MAGVGPTSGPTWRLSHLLGVHLVGQNVLRDVRPVRGVARRVTAGQPDDLGGVVRQAAALEQRAWGAVALSVTPMNKQ